VANGETANFLEGSAPALPKIRLTIAPSSSHRFQGSPSQTPNDFQHSENSLAEAGGIGDFRWLSFDVDTRNDLRHNGSELCKEGSQMGSGADKKCKDAMEGLKALAFRYAVFFAFYFWRR
jgi:hypothetical protein